jgi:hypothetical protein
MATQTRLTLELAMDELAGAVDRHIAATTAERERTRREKYAPEDKTETIACGEGCAHCCAYSVQLSWAEAVWIAGHVEQLPGRRRREYIDRLLVWCQEFTNWVRTTPQPHAPAGSDQATQSRFGKLQAARWGVRRKACPFLDLETFRCGIYAHRPLVCRTHLVLHPPAGMAPDPATGAPVAEPPDGCVTRQSDIDQYGGPPTVWMPADAIGERAAEKAAALAKHVGLQEGHGLLPLLVVRVGQQKYGWPARTHAAAAVPEVPYPLPTLTRPAE